jgi:hypothetical protein
MYDNGNSRVEIGLRRIFEDVRKKLHYPPITHYRLGNRTGLEFGREIRLLLSKNDVKLPENQLKGLLALLMNFWCYHPYALKNIILEEYYLKDFEKRVEIRMLFDEILSAIDLYINKNFPEILHYYKSLNATMKHEILLKNFMLRFLGVRVEDGEMVGGGRGDGEVDDSYEDRHGFEREIGEDTEDKEDEIKNKVEELMKIDFLDRREMRLKLNIQRFARIVEDCIEIEKVSEKGLRIEDFGEREMDSALREIAREVDKKEFEEICHLIGKKTKTKVKHPEKLWYLEKSRNYSIFIQPLKKTGSLYPLEISDFEFDDNIEVYSAVDSFGKIVPGIAKKYEFHDFKGRDEGIPDAVVVIDSSGSMTDPSKYVSYAVLGAMVIARNYLENGAKVGVVNFSNENISVPPMRGERVFDAIILYQGGGTHLDVIELERYLRGAGTVDVVIITDGGIENIEEVSRFTARLNSLTVIWVKRDVFGIGEFKRRVEKIAGKFDIFEVEDEKDIPSIAVRRFVERYA